MSQLLDEAQAHILRLFKTNTSQHLFYHDFNHTVEVVAMSEKMAQYYHLSASEQEILLLAAWFHDAGYLYIYQNHEDKSIELAKDFLETNQYPNLAQVVACIEATRLGSVPANFLAELLADADIAYGVTEEYWKRSPLLRIEWQHQQKNYTDLEWEKLQYQFLQNVQFHTEYGKCFFAPIVHHNLVEQRKVTEATIRKFNNQAQDNLKKQEKKDEKKQKQKKLEVLTPYGKLEPNVVPIKGIQSFFRTVYPNHQELSAIADNKANMMISINSMVITLIVAIFSVGVGGVHNLRDSPFLIPIILFILTALISLVLAVFSVMPKVTRVHKQKMQNSETARQAVRDNMVFFGNFADISLAEYEKIAQEVFSDSHLLYGNMTRDMYNLGKVLQRKYQLLTISYAAFLTGLTISVVTFFVVIFI